MDDGFQIYLHAFVVTPDGDWAVVQQGMNDASGLARRYHWHSATVRDFVADPHTAIVGEIGRHDPQPRRRPRRAGAGGAADDRARPIRPPRSPRSGASRCRRATTCAARDVHERRLGAVLALAHERELRDFASFLLLEQLGPRTLQSLALVAEVVHGAPARFDDPARFSFAHGGKDGHPFPVPLTVYDESIAVLRRALDAARLGHTREARRLLAGSTRSPAPSNTAPARRPTSKRPSPTSAPSRDRSAAGPCSTTSGKSPPVRARASSVSFDRDARCRRDKARGPR